MPDDALQRLRVRFVGRVQGVGFRAALVRAAQGSAVSGWVRNEPDGSVCAELQGTPDQIARVLEHFGRHRPGRVDSEDVMDVQPEPALPDAGFIVAR